MKKIIILQMRALLIAMLFLFVCSSAWPSVCWSTTTCVIETINGDAEVLCNNSSLNENPKDYEFGGILAHECDDASKLPAGLEFTDDNTGYTQDPGDQKHPNPLCGKGYWVTIALWSKDPNITVPPNPKGLPSVTLEVLGIGFTLKSTGSGNFCSYYFPIPVVDKKFPVSDCGTHVKLIKQDCHI